MSLDLQNVITEHGGPPCARGRVAGDAWYVVLGIELFLFATILAPLIYGALKAP
jgi:hypothetical protein